MDNITYTNGAMSEAEVYIMKWIKSIDNNEIFNNWISNLIGITYLDL